MNKSFDSRNSLELRLKRPTKRLMDARTTLKHFALINYALPKERLIKLIPSDRFEIPEFQTERGMRSFISVVPFLDVDFHFPQFAPKSKSSFYQTNHRAYIIDKATGEHAVWFFGTNLGSRFVYFPQLLWKMPWHYANYLTDCRYDYNESIYEKYSYYFESEWCKGEVEIEDTGEPITKMDGFSSLDEMKLILTHPITGFFRRSDRKIGTYKIWHPEMKLTAATGKHLHFSLYEKLGLLSNDEMNEPHSIFLCPQIEFEIYLPPKAVEGSRAA